MQKLENGNRLYFALDGSEEHSNKIQYSEIESIRFSMTEATICALMLDFHLFGKRNSGQMDAFYTEKYFEIKEKHKEHCEFEWIIELCIKQANNGPLHIALINNLLGQIIGYW